MAENMIKFLRGNVASLPQTATSGAVYFTKDEGLYLGLEDGSYHRYGDFITVADVASLPATGAHESCMYYCESENILAKWNGVKWVQINKQQTLAELGGVAKSVYEAKMAALEKADSDNATAISELNDYVGTIPEASEATNIVAYVQEKTSGIATDSALEELTDRVSDAEKAIDAIEADYLKAADKTELQGKIDDKASQGDLDAAADRITALENANKEGGAVATQIAAAQEAANNAKTAADNAQDAADKAQDEIDALELAVGEVEEGKTVVGMIGDAQTAADNAQSAVDELSDKVGEVPADKTVVQMIADAQDAATYDDTDIKADIKANADAIDAIEADYLKAADKTDLSDAIAAEADRADAAEKANATAIKAISDDYLKASDKTELQGNIDTVSSAIERLTNGVSAEEIDGVNDLIQYVKDHGTEVTGIRNDIQANADAIDALAPVASTGSWNDLVDRPFYEDSTREVVHPETSYYPEDSLGFDLATLEPGTYYVKIRTNDEKNDGVEPREYTLDIPEALLYGRSYPIVDENGDHVAWISYNSGWQIEFAEQHDSTWMSIEKEVSQIVYLDEKFIPDTIARVSDQNNLASRVTDAEADIDALQDKVGDKSVSEQISDIANPIADRVEALEDKAHEHANKALLDTYTQTEADLADAVAKKHEHANAAELAKIADGDVAKWNAAEQNAKSYADGLNNTMGDRVKAIEDDYLKAADKTALNDLITAEADRAKAAEKANADAIAVLNGDASTDGSVAKALADAKAYADGKDSAMNTRVEALEAINHEAYKGYADQAEADAISASKAYAENLLTWGSF